MKFRYQAWIRYFLASALSFAIIIPISLNVLIDPFSIYHTNLLKHELSTNQRFNKIEYLKYNQHIYNSFMLGNSRIGTTHPKILERYIPNSRFYNLTLSTANMEDMLTHIEYLLNHEHNLQNIYLQLDYQDMIYWGHPAENYESKKHPDVEKSGYLKFYLDYSLILPFQIFKEKIIRNISNNSEKHVFHDINNTGMWIDEGKEQAITHDPKKYIKLEPSFHTKATDIWKKDESVYPKMLTALKTIVLLCEQNNVNLILYTTPYNHAMLNYFNIPDIIQYLQDISEIHDYYFFADYNSVTLNNENYYESGHFRGIVGELIAARIFNDQKIKIPSDFGKHITKENFLLHQNRLRRNFHDHRKWLLEQ